MGLFDIFKKKETLEYDPNNVRVTHLRKGFMLDYDMKTWEVKACYEYDWGNNFFTYEYKIDTGEEVAYLSVIEDDELNLTVCKKVNIRTINEDLPELIIDNGQPPKKLIYNGITLFLDSQNPGYFRDTDDGEDDVSEFIAWDYYDEAEKYVLSIEQWGEKTFDAAFGKTAKEYHFFFFCPSKQPPRK